MTIFKNAIFQSRYLILDLHGQTLSVKKKRKCEQQQLHTLQEILSCSCRDQPWLQGARERTQAFQVKTRKRDYVFLAANEIERQMWMDAIGLVMAIQAPIG